MATVKKPKVAVSNDIEQEAVFNLLDGDTLDRLIRDGAVKMPERQLKVPKDERWNEKQLNSKLIQGLENGESIMDIANRMLSVVGKNNEASAMRNARTMVTSAENHGRLDSYENLASQGVVQKKVWIATADDRTRESHLDMDGEEVDIDEEFSNGCQFPADESCGDPSEVWNCRCSMRSHIVGFMRADGSISYVNRDRDDTGHNEKIEEEKERRHS